MRHWQGKLKVNSSVYLWVTRVIEIGALALSFLWAIEAYANKSDAPSRGLASVKGQNYLKAPPGQDNRSPSLLPKTNMASSGQSLGIGNVENSPTSGQTGTAVSPTLFQNPYFVQPTKPLIRF